MIKLKPDAYYASVLDIDPRDLEERGYRAVLLDLDNTLQPRSVESIPSAVIEWVDGLKARGFKVALISNTAQERAYNAAETLDVPLIPQAFKPLKRGYIRACAYLGVPCRDAVMIGDQCYTDIAGAHRVGMGAIMVVPQSDEDPLMTHVLRSLDKRAVRGMSARRRES